MPFIPESPRWLAYHDRHDECREVVAKVNCNGQVDDPVVLVQYREIIDTIAFEKARGQNTASKVLKDMVVDPGTRKRNLLSLSVAVISMLSGNNVISYYLGTMLDNAGVTDSTTQLQIVSKPPSYPHKRS